MRVRLTDGTHEIEINTDGRGAPTLHDIEATAGRLLEALRRAPAEPPLDEQPFGFALSADTERAEPHIEPGRDDYDDEDRHT